MWGEKVNLGLKVTPRMRGFSTRGRVKEWRVTCGCLWVWWVSGEKRDTVVFCDFSEVIGIGRGQVVGMRVVVYMGLKRKGDKWELCGTPILMCLYGEVVLL